MPPLPRKQSTTAPRESSPSFKRKRTRSSPELTTKYNGSADQAEQANKTLEYPAFQMRDSVLFDTSLITAEFHPHTSRILLATTSAHEVAMVYLPPSDSDQHQHRSSDPQVNGDVSSRSSRRRKISWLRDQTREEARAGRQQQQRTSEAEPMELDPASSQVDETKPLAAENPSGTDVEMEDQLTEAPGLSSDAS